MGYDGKPNTYNLGIAKKDSPREGVTMHGGINSYGLVTSTKALMLIFISLITSRSTLVVDGKRKVLQGVPGQCVFK